MTGGHPLTLWGVQLSYRTAVFPKGVRTICHASISRIDTAAESPLSDPDDTDYRERLNRRVGDKAKSLRLAYADNNGQ